ncbi:MAG: hypothetical protein V2B19_29215 [Pseudomonadota bacterium]
MNETNILKKQLKYDFDGKVALVTGVKLKAVESTICIFIKAADWG